MTSKTRLFLLFAAAGIAFAASCKSDRVAPFPHETHATMGAACADCHGAKGGERPTVETCKGCHAEATENVTPAQVEAMMAAFASAPGAYGLVFDHAKHDGIACGDCHKLGTSGPSTGQMQNPAMATCMDACHGAKAQAPLTCDACHATLDAAGRPSDHAAGWLRQHGSTATASSADCKSCHTENTCFTCHQTSKPRDHNQAWRLRGHGVVAQMDRERCASCHRQDMCSRCHMNTQPINHTNSWKGGATTHCRSCHLPLTQSTCATCHQRAVHSAAPAWPTNMTHVTGANCRVCHSGPGAGLNHPDNGDNCESCHAK